MTTAPDIQSLPTAEECDLRRWKNAALAQRLFIIHNLMMRVGDRLVAHLDLTSSRWLLLGALEQFDQPPTLSELSGHSLLSVQNVSRMIGSMEADGLVERYTVRGMGRSTFVRLTDKGKHMHIETEQAARVFAGGFLAGLSQEQIVETEGRLEQLLVNLERMEQELNAQQQERGDS